MNKFKITGFLILFFSFILLFVFQLQNEILDFITGMLLALGLSLILGLIPNTKTLKNKF
jgi:hypothetical protein